MFHPQRIPKLLAAAAVMLLSTGCLQTYQPMAGLHQPVIVDPRAGNLKDVRLTVHCVPGDFLDRRAADDLCRKVQVLFENQGANVHTMTNTAFGDLDDLDGPTGAEAEAAPPTDLTLELRARKLHEARHPMMWLLCVASFTVVPAMNEYTFAQDVVVRDGTGFVLLRDSLRGRIIHQFGVGIWASNGVMNLLWRNDEDKINNETVKQDISGDLYRQLSQLVFNAKLRWQVMQQPRPPASGGE